ncbi:hypothetical protein F4805DRAFT_191503 [Annulohypoxylon moriforme]|nr:hypothetical protein F4805DRAFT_191503 [Annulohypoxylon moriforme]
MNVFDMPPLYSIVLFLFCLVSTCVAQLDDSSLPYGYYSSSSLTARPWSPQFEKWYPNHGVFLANVSEGICNLTLRDYRAAYAAPRGSLEASRIRAICYRHEACILSQYSQNFQANAQGASVILGFIPSLLSASIGPSISEIYLLSIHRPLLATLTTLGSPAYQVFKLFEYHHPGRLLHAEENQLQFRVFSKLPAIFCSGVELHYSTGSGRDGPLYNR